MSDAPSTVARVKVLKAFRFRLEPTPGQERQFARTAGCCRYVYNRALALNEERFKRGEKRLGFAALCRELTGWRHAPETAWLAEAPAQALQQALKNLDRAYRNRFDGRAERPCFHKKGERDTFRLADVKAFAVDSEHGRVKLPKAGWVQYRNSRAVEGAPKQVTVARECGHWFVSIQVELEVAAPVHPATTAVGVDLGVAKFAALSTGEVIAAPVARLLKLEGQLKRAQRSLSRKVKRSANWQKQKARIAKLSHRIANVRKDFLHKASTTISQNHALVVLEDLRVKSMSKSAKGTVNAPGRNVRAKAGLNRSILRQGWGEFRRQLEYKQQWRGGMVLAIDPRNTSRRCAECGHVSAENRKTQAAFACVACGHQADADVNAAINILAAGCAVNACGETARSGPSTKQEPSVSVAA